MDKRALSFQRMKKRFSLLWLAPKEKSRFDCFFVFVFVLQGFVCPFCQASYPKPSSFTSHVSRLHDKNEGEPSQSEADLEVPVQYVIYLLPPSHFVLHVQPILLKPVQWQWKWAKFFLVNVLNSWKIPPWRKLRLLWTSSMDFLPVWIQCAAVAFKIGNRTYNPRTKASNTCLNLNERRSKAFVRSFRKMMISLRQGGAILFKVLMWFLRSSAVLKDARLCQKAIRSWRNTSPKSTVRALIWRKEFVCKRFQSLKERKDSRQMIFSVVYFVFLT